MFMALEQLLHLLFLLFYFFAHNSPLLKISNKSLWPKNAKKKKQQMSVKESRPVSIQSLALSSYISSIGLPCSDIQLASVRVCVWRAVSLPSMPQLRGERFQDTSSSQPLLTHRTSCRGRAAPVRPCWASPRRPPLPRFHPIWAHPDVFPNPPLRDCHYSPAQKKNL